MSNRSSRSDITRRSIKSVGTCTGRVNSFTSVNSGMDPYSNRNNNNGARPVRIDSNVRFSSIGGLKEHIKCLREMVLFPLMYPELFTKFDTRPAKGVLFYGPPGTGKTLLARALANECSLVSGKRVSFFMRKGADCLEKWVGQSEANLRELFQAASRLKPSIIFFDEIDALAPVRTRKSEVHASVVGTLLAEMDGLQDRGEIVIIGATNRPDALDPAVRRAGRFDRELYFPPPEADARLDILKIYTRCWQPAPSDQVLACIAKATTGYLGSDIKALCSEAVLKAVRRVYPQIYESEFKLLIDPKNVEVTMDDMVSAMTMLSPAAARYHPLAAKPLPKHCKPLLDAQVEAAYVMLRDVFPPVSFTKKSTVNPPSVFLVSGPCADTLLAPALLAKLEPCVVKELSVSTLHQAKEHSLEQAVISMFSECRRAGACVLFVRDLVAVWNALSWSRGHGCALLMQLWRAKDVGEGTLLLAACETSHCDLPSELREIFPSYKDCVYNIRQPTAAEVTSFLKPVMCELPLLPPVVQVLKAPPPLPRAPLPSPHMTEEEIARRREREAAKLRQLRIILRGICRNLTYDRRFIKFAKPVDVTKMPDYLERIKRPMDLGTMLLKVDMQQYYCAKEFLDDIDLICTNALEYNPDQSTSDKKIRLEVCSLRELAQAAINEEIESAFELECLMIAKRRRETEAKEGGGSPPTDRIYFADLTMPFPPDLPDLLGQQWEDLPSRKRRQTNSGARERDSKRQKPECHNKDSGTSGIKMTKVDGNEHNAQNTTSSDGRDNAGSDMDPVKILINIREMDDILNKNVESLRKIGLEALIELYGDLSKSVHQYSFTHNRLNLPRDMGSIMSKYMQLANKNNSS